MIYVKGVANQLSQPSNFLASRNGTFFGYNQKGVRGSNFVVGDSKSLIKLPKLKKNCCINYPSCKNKL